MVSRGRENYQQVIYQDDKSVFWYIKINESNLLSMFDFVAAEPYPAQQKIDKWPGQRKDLRHVIVQFGDKTRREYPVGSIRADVYVRGGIYLFPINGELRVGKVVFMRGEHMPFFLLSKSALE